MLKKLCRYVVMSLCLQCEHPDIQGVFIKQNDELTHPTLENLSKQRACDMTTLPIRAMGNMVILFPWKRKPLLWFIQRQ